MTTVIESVKSIWNNQNIGGENYNMKLDIVAQHYLTEGWRYVQLLSKKLIQGGAVHIYFYEC